MNFRTSHIAHKFIIAFVAFIYLLLSPIAFADNSIIKPTGKVVLSITQAGDKTDFDMTMIMALPSTSYITNTPWTEAPTKFEGVMLADLLSAINATGTTLIAKALDDYSISIPVADTSEYAVLIAYKMDGKMLEDGVYAPLWVMYPYDSDPALNVETYHGRSIWQLREIEVK